MCGSGRMHLIPCKYQLNRAREILFTRYWCQFMCKVHHKRISLTWSTLYWMSLKIISLVLGKSYLVIICANLCGRLTKRELRSSWTQTLKQHPPFDIYLSWSSQIKHIAYVYHSLMTQVYHVRLFKKNTNYTWYVFFFMALWEIMSIVISLVNLRSKAITTPILTYWILIHASVVMRLT